MQNWFEVKTKFIKIDETAGKEKKVNNYFLVAADNIKQAIKRLKEGLSYVLVPYQITSITLSQIADVFPYFELEHVRIDSLPKLDESKEKCIVYDVDEEAE
jgi:hypothetical protein